MATPATPASQHTECQSASNAEMRARLTSLDDALLTLLAKRLASALLLDTDDQIERDPVSAAFRQVDSGQTDSHSRPIRPSKGPRR
jgi:hypothetical protein